MQRVSKMALFKSAIFTIHFQNICNTEFRAYIISRISSMASETLGEKIPKLASKFEVSEFVRAPIFFEDSRF